MFQFLGVTSGRVWPAPPDMVPDTESYYKGSMAATIFFYLGLWSVKAAFLVFFKRLISDIRSLTIHWWVVTVFTFLCLVACFADTNYWCRLAPLSEIVKKCSGGPEIEKVLVVLKLNTAFDVITDFLIMSIPFTILWHVRVQAKKKLALLGLFSLVMITALFAILRAALVTKYSRQPEPSWLYIWTAVEHSMAVIVACLGTFRGLFVHEDKPLIGPAYSVREYSRKLFARNKPKHPLEESISMDDSILFPPQTRSISTGNSHEPFGLVDSTQKQSNFVHKPIEMPKRTGQVKS
ncbi:unnamed protein product [Periconia digitata]|uniref:Rhodopsin domain-containing protein n=1 Tax=Periconia digitata TaxID=1303443 RepID=A0A9W4XLV5_9PLEO|nr:unnamed protein product [Periconia digitata]